MNLRGLVVVLAAAPLAACVHSSSAAYETRSVADTGPPSAVYRVPADAPRGTVWVMSMGPERLSDPGGPRDYLHLQVAAQNDSDADAWTLDPREQVLVLASGARLPATYARASSGGNDLSLAPAARGHMDLYYPMPVGNDASRVELSWQLRRGATLVAQQTAFNLAQPPGQERDVIVYHPAPRVGVGIHLGWGPWWMAPYPWYGYGYGPYYYDYWGFHRPYPYWRPYHRPYRPYAPYARPWRSPSRVIAPPAGSWSGGGHRGAPSGGRSVWRGSPVPAR